MTGTVGILNVGAGDIALSFDPANPVERFRAARVVKDMIRRGFALLIEVERDGEKRFERALDFDEQQCRYIIADFDSSAAQQADRIELELSCPLADLAIDKGMENDHGESVTVEDTPHPASDGTPAKRGRPKKYRTSVDVADRQRQSPWDAALAADQRRLDEPWGDPPEAWKWPGILTRRSYAEGFARIAREKSEWAGIPVQIPGERLTIEKSYFAADKQEELNRIMNPNLDVELRVCRNEDVNEEVRERNTFWSDRLRGHVVIWQEGKHFTWGVHRTNRLDYDMRTLGCADAWSLETEEKALGCLHGLVSHQQFRQYLLTGQFLETSKRSKLFYVFRRLRPTLAISGATGKLRILAGLCLHSVGYYQNSFAGALCPTDDVISHLVMARGDEKLFWRRANQHHPSRPECGL